MSSLPSNRVDGLNQIKDKICDVIFKRNETKLLLQILQLFERKFSVRRMSLIGDINALFDHLERLELGSLNNFWAFLEISQFLKDPELEETIKAVGGLPIPEHFFCCQGRNLFQFRRLNKTTPPVNYSAKESEGHAAAAPPVPSPPPPSFNDPLQSRIFDLLSCEIGKRWRDLGRSLNFHEADLDEFEERFSHNLRERIHAMLTEFAKSHSSNSTEGMAERICEALDKCKRIDLRKRVQRFMANRN